MEKPTNGVIECILLRSKHNCYCLRMPNKYMNFKITIRNERKLKYVREYGTYSEPGNSDGYHYRLAAFTSGRSRCGSTAAMTKMQMRRNKSGAVRGIDCGWTGVRLYKYTFYEMFTWSQRFGSSEL